MSLYPGLYEQVINNDLTHELAEIPDACKAVAPVSYTHLTLPTILLV